MTDKNTSSLTHSQQLELDLADYLEARANFMQAIPQAYVLANAGQMLQAAVPGPNATALKNLSVNIGQIQLEVTELQQKLSTLAVQGNAANNNSKGQDEIIDQLDFDPKALLELAGDYQQQAQALKSRFTALPDEFNATIDTITV